MSVLPGVRPGACSDCPWRKASAPGWIGPYTVEEWCSLVVSDEPIACHQTVRVDGDWSDPSVRQCYGATAFRKNISKVPRDPQVARLYYTDPLIFESIAEFRAHHERQATATFAHMDQKFRGVITKNKDDSVVPDDQWIVFLVKDNAVPRMLLAYLHECVLLGAGEDQVSGVLDLIDRVKKWREEHPDLCKVPDLQPGELRP